LIPYWPKDIKIGFSTNQCRPKRSTQTGVPQGVPQQRCLVPLDSFDE